MHDLNKGGSAREALARWQKVLGVSAWHADYLRQVYGLDNTGYVPNGIELDRFTQSVAKVPFRCVYASSPDRGLDRLLQLWPRIVENEPTAELQIAYGWETIDKTIAMGYQPLAAFKDYIISLIAKTPNVVWRGRLPQDELAKLYGEAYALLYPADFLEVSCIVAMEAMAAGCPIVASGAGALPETIGDGGLVVKGNVYTRAWRDYYTHITKAVLHSPDIRNEYAQKGRERAQQLTWDRSYSEHWKPILDGLLEGEKPRELVTCG
jgi:glycosyltransferase involved in cell wall biosynthesis